ncbi:MAG: hypothetical protein ABFC24_12345 [Methanoregulaceae archaeon]
MTVNHRKPEKKKFKGIPLFLIPRVVQEQVRKKRAKLSRIHIVRARYNQFTVAIVWLPKKREGDDSPESVPGPDEGTGEQ